MNIMHSSTPTNAYSYKQSVRLTLATACIPFCVTLLRNWSDLWKWQAKKLNQLKWFFVLENGRKSIDCVIDELVKADEDRKGIRNWKCTQIELLHAINSVHVFHWTQVMWTLNSWAPQIDYSATSFGNNGTMKLNENKQWAMVEATFNIACEQFH